MIRSRGIPNARPVEKPVVQAAGWTSAVLIVGFLALQTPPAVTIFAWVAQALAVCAEPFLGLFGYAIVRTGVELRDTLTGHAIAVTSACDGSGLLLSAAAALTWFRVRGAPMRSWPYVIALMSGSIFAFNLIRVLAIFCLIGTPELMQAVHLYVAPLLSAVLVGALALHACRVRLPEHGIVPVFWLGIGFIAALAWYFVGYASTCGTILPVANALLSLLPDLLTDSLACRGDGAVLVTSGLVTIEPPSVLNVPFYPADFTLAVPLIAASLATMRRVKPIVWGALAGVATCAIAMVLAALTAGNDQATASGITRLIGQNFTMPYMPASGLVIALLKTLQNTAVHFNLFLLPLLLLGLDNPARLAVPPQQRPRARREIS